MTPYRSSCTLLLSAMMSVALHAQSSAPHAELARATFIENIGQWHSDARFLCRTPDLDVWITRTGAVYDYYRIERPESDPRLPLPSRPATRRRSGDVVAMEFGSVSSEAHGTEVAAGVHNYIVGDRATWRRDAYAYRSVRLESVAENIAARFYLDDGRPRYDVIVEPGGRIEDITMRFRGASSLVVSDSTLVIGTSLGPIIQQGLFAYQIVDGERRRVACTFRAIDGTTCGFSVGDYDSRSVLVIDPLVYASYLGGSGNELITEMQHGPNGNLIFAGETTSADFPTSVGAYRDAIQGYDAFVGSINPTSGDLRFSTFFGGRGYENARALDVDIDGNIYLTGTTSSSDFPVSEGNVARFPTAYDAFVAVLEQNGSGLIYSNVFGGSGFDIGSQIRPVDNGMIVTGWTSSADFPTTPGAYDQTPNDSTDIFVARYDIAGGAPTYATLTGGNSLDLAEGLAIARNGDVLVTGQTWSTNFPTTTGAVDTSNRPGTSDAFVLRLSSSGDRLLSSTLLGGEEHDHSYDVEERADGSIIIAGHSGSHDFVVTEGAYDRQAPIDGVDAYIACLSADLSALRYATFFGNSHVTFSMDVDIATNGDLFLTGWTTSDRMPLQPSSQSRLLNGSTDAFIARFDSSAGRLLYSTYVGGSGDETAYSIVVRDDASAAIAGHTTSSDLDVTARGHDTTSGGGSDAYIAIARTDAASSIAVSHAEPSMMVSLTEDRIRVRCDSPGVVELLDVRGEVVAASIHTAERTADDSVVYIDASGLTSGLYFVRAASGDGFITQPIAITR